MTHLPLPTETVKLIDSYVFDPEEIVNKVNKECSDLRSLIKNTVENVIRNEFKPRFRQILEDGFERINVPKFRDVIEKTEKLLKEIQKNPLSKGKLRPSSIFYGFCINIDSFINMTLSYLKEYKNFNINSSESLKFPEKVIAFSTFNEQVSYIYDIFENEHLPEGYYENEMKNMREQIESCRTDIEYENICKHFNDLINSNKDIIEDFSDDIKSLIKLCHNCEIYAN